MDTRILFDGGYEVLAKDIDPKVVEGMLVEHLDHSEPNEFLRLQNTDYGEDGLILRPSKVIALQAA